MYIVVEKNTIKSLITEYFLLYWVLLTYRVQQIFLDPDPILVNKYCNTVCYCCLICNYCRKWTRVLQLKCVHMLMGRVQRTEKWFLNGLNFYRNNTWGLFAFPNVLPSTEGFLSQEKVHCCHGYIGTAASFAFPPHNANIQSCKRRSITLYSVPYVNFVQPYNHKSYFILYNLCEFTKSFPKALV